MALIPAFISTKMSAGELASGYYWNVEYPEQINDGDGKEYIPE